MIVNMVKAAFDRAKENKTEDEPILGMLISQFEMVKRPSKSGDIVTDDKAKEIIQRFISGIERDKLFNPSNATVEESCNKRIELLKSFLKD